MTPDQKLQAEYERLCRKLREWIARSAGQHKRAIRAGKRLP